MTTDALDKRRLLARISIAFGVPWLLALAGFRLLGWPLLDVELAELGILMIHATNSLIVLSIIIVPLVAWYQGRLCRRHDHSLRAHVRIGSTTASISAVVLFIISRFTGVLMPSYIFMFPRWSLFCT